jgi:hypothetical protein
MVKDPVAYIDHALESKQESVDIITILNALKIDVLEYTSKRGNLAKLYGIFHKAFKEDQKDIGNYSNFCQQYAKFRELKEGHTENIKRKRRALTEGKRKRKKTTVVIPDGLKERAEPTNGIPAKKPKKTVKQKVDQDKPEEVDLLSLHEQGQQLKEKIESDLK